MDWLSIIKVRVDTKLLVGAGLVSLFIYVFYWFYVGYENFFGFLFATNPTAVNYVTYLGIVFWAGHVGLNARIIGVFLGLLSLVLLSLRITRPSKIRVLVSTALFLESIYFLLYIPYLPYLWGPGTSFLASAYFVQFLLVTPFLMILALKTFRLSRSLADKSFWKWAGMAFVAYISAFWVNVMFRWFDMASSEGLSLLLGGVVVVSFLNSVVFMSLAVAFSVLAARSLTKGDSKAPRWIGLALIMLGLRYTVYLIYSYFTGMLNFVLLDDIWTIPLIVLGLSLLIGKSVHFSNGEEHSL